MTTPKVTARHLDTCKDSFSNLEAVNQIKTPQSTAKVNTKSPIGTLPGFLLLLILVAVVVISLLFATYQRQGVMRAYGEIGDWVKVASSVVHQTKVDDSGNIAGNATETTEMQFIVIKDDLEIVEFLAIVGKTTIETLENNTFLSSQDETLNEYPLIFLKVNKTNNEIIAVSATRLIEPQQIEESLRILRQMLIRPEDYSESFSRVAEGNSQRCPHEAVFGTEKYCASRTNVLSRESNEFRSQFTEESHSGRKLLENGFKLNVSEAVFLNKNTNLIEKSVSNIDVLQEIVQTAYSYSTYISKQSIESKFEIANKLTEQDVNYVQNTIQAMNFTSFELRKSHNSEGNPVRKLPQTQKTISVFDFFGEKFVVKSGVKVTNPKAITTSKYIQFTDKIVTLADLSFGEDVITAIGRLVTLKKYILADTQSMLTNMTAFSNQLKKELLDALDQQLQTVKNMTQEILLISQPPIALITAKLDNFTANYQNEKNETLNTLNASADQLSAAITAKISSNSSYDAEQQQLAVIQDKIQQINNGNYSFQTEFAAKGLINLNSILSEAETKISEIAVWTNRIKNVSEAAEGLISRNFSQFKASFDSYATGVSSYFSSISSLPSQLPANSSDNIFNFSAVIEITTSLETALQDQNQSIATFLSSVGSKHNLTDIQTAAQKSNWTSVFADLKAKTQLLFDSYHITSPSLEYFSTVEDNYNKAVNQSMELLVGCISVNCSKLIDSAALNSSHSSLQQSISSQNTTIFNYLQSVANASRPIETERKTMNVTIPNVRTEIGNLTLEMLADFNISRAYEVKAVLGKSVKAELKTNVVFRLIGNHKTESGLVRISLLAGIDGNVTIDSHLDFTSISSFINGDEILAMVYSGKYSGKMSKNTITIIPTCWTIRTGRSSISICIYKLNSFWSDYKKFIGKPIGDSKRIQLDGFSVTSP